MDIVRVLKKLPIDVGQAERKHDTAGKRIAWRVVPDGRGKVAVDVGCRDGFWSERLKRKGYTVHALDIEPHYPGVITYDVEGGLPFADASIDLVWCTEVIEHLRDPGKFLNEVERVMRPGGIAVLTTPNSAWWIYPILRVGGKSPASVQNPDHKHFFSFSRIKQLAPQYRVQGFFPYVRWAPSIQHAVGMLSPTFILIRQF